MALCYREAHGKQHVSHVLCAHIFALRNYIYINRLLQIVLVGRAHVGKGTQVLGGQQVVISPCRCASSMVTSLLLCMRTLLCNIYFY